MQQHEQCAVLLGMSASDQAHHPCVFEPHASDSSPADASCCACLLYIKLCRKHDCVLCWLLCAVVGCGGWVQVWPAKYGGGREGVGRLVSCISELLLVPLNIPSRCLASTSEHINFECCCLSVTSRS